MFFLNIFLNTYIDLINSLDLLQYDRIFDLIIMRQQDDLGQNNGGHLILVNKGQEEVPNRFCIIGNNTYIISRHLMNRPAAQMHFVGGKHTFHKREVVLNMNISQV